MAVIIGSARIDENGKASGGRAGDQTAREVSTQEWYLHSKGWKVIRAKDASVREKIAQDMQWACDNPHIGYDQDDRETLYDVAKAVKFNCSKVTKNCETDCSALVRVCVNYAGISVGDFYTGNEVSVLKATGAFEIITTDKICNSSDYLMRGDILVTKKKGHTVVVLTDGAKIGSPAIKVDPAQEYNKSFGGRYQAKTDLNMRTGAGTAHDVVTVLAEGSVVRNYGYYTVHNEIVWLLVDFKGKIGYCSAKYLKRI